MSTSNYLKKLEELKVRANGTSSSNNSSNESASSKSVLERIKASANETYEVTPTISLQGKKGWQKYLDDEEAAKNAPKYDLNNDGKDSWWEKFIGYLGGNGGGVVDTTLPTAEVTQTIHDLRADDSYRRPNDDWSETQRLEFGALYIDSPQKAYAYAEQTNNANKKAKEEAEIKKVQDSATSGFWAGVGHTAGAIASAPLGMADYLSDLAYANAGRDIAPDGQVSPFEYSQAVTGGISEHLNEEGGTLDEDIPIIGGKGWGDVYGLGTSIAQSMVSAYTLGPIGTLVSYFGQGAASGVDDALSRGASEEQAVVYGIALGVFEGLAEMVGVDKLFKLGSSSTIKGFIKNILSQAGAEGTEEGLTSLLSNIADTVIMRDKSNFNFLVAQYMAQGMSESDAMKKAWMDSVEGIAFDTIAGAISGGVSGGVHTTAQTIASNINAKKIYGNGADLVTEALDIDANNEYAQKMQAKLDKGKNLSGGQINRLVETNEQALMAQDTAKMKSAVETRLTELGESGDISKLADVIVKAQSGGKLTSSERSVLTNSKYGRRVSTELNPRSIESGEYTSKWAENIGTERINEKAYNKDLYDLATKQAGVEIGEEKASATKNLASKEIVTKGKFKASESGKTKIGDTEVSIKEIASIKNGEMTLRLEDGSTVKASDVEYGSNNEALLYENVVHMGLNAATANAFINGYDGNMPVAEYALDFSQAYRYGELGVPKSELGFSSKLTDSQKSFAYDLGKTDAKYKASEKEKIVSTVANKSEKIASKGKKKGKLHNTLTPTNETQRASLKALGVLAETLNIDIYTFESPLVNGKRVGENGSYDPITRSLRIDLYAGADGKGTMLYTAAHELTHDIREKLPAKFKAFADFLFEQYGEKGISVSELIEKKRAFLEEKGRITPDMTEAQAYDLAYEEVVADACESFLADGDAVAKIAELKAKDKTLWQTIKDFITKLVARIKAAYEGLSPDSVEGRLVAEMLDSAEKLKAMWVDMVVEASEVSDIVEIDTNTESVAPMFSERTWTASEYVTEREKTAKAISKALNVDIKTAYKYIDDINSVARLIADDRVRLDYEPNLDDKASVLKPNSEYKYTVDMSTLCAKRLLFTGTFDAIQKALPNMVFDSEDIVALREMMQKRDYEVACGICYVESTRREIGRITQEFIDRYKIAQKTGKPISRINSSGKEVVLTSAGRTFSADKNYTPNLGELNTTDIDIVKRDHREVYDAYLAFMNARGQAKPKLLETRAEYKGEILKSFKAKSSVEARNRAGGLRLQSFSDFEVPHLIDMMQIVMDMSRVGLKSQAYTKVPAFAEVFGDTGVKINLSLIAKGDGLDSNGNLIFDDVEGINHKEAFKLRDKYSKNVGTILVGKTDAHIIAAMADPRIDYIIPFHKSSWKESLYDALGLTGYADYTDYQNEKPIDKDRKIKNFDPSEYWDFSKTGDENAQIYLAKCREDGRIPKFSQFQGYPGYWKLLIDFKMYDNDGIGAPQEVVKPVFNTEASEKILREYEGGHRNFPVAKDVVEDFVKEHKDKVKYSDRYQYAEENPDILSMTARVESGNFRANEKVYLGTVSDHIAKQIQSLTGINVDGFEVAIEARQIEHILKDHGKNGATDRSMANPSDIAKIEYALKNYDDIRSAGKTRAYKHVVDGKTVWVDTVLYEKEIGEKSYYVVQAVPDTKAKTLYIVTAFIGKKGYKKEVSQFIDAKSLDATSKNEIATTSGSIISQETNSVNRKFSDRNSYSLTFYSYMGKVIDGIKLDKMGAGGVVSYLKGRGVKNEEIKWSGIEAWLEGKKSVTKAELQEFVAGSQLTIEEEMSGVNQEAYDELEALWVKHAGVSLSETFSDDFDLPLTADNMADVLDDMEKEGYDVPPMDVQHRMLELAKETGNEGRWSKYKLSGGTNYRELVFKMPDSSYSNNAMQAHWGQDAEGVLAHARIQDITTSDGKKMLFIEEIQSDWHNEGAKDGYQDAETESKIKRLKEEADIAFYELEDYSTELTGMAGEYEAVAKTQKGRELLRNHYKTRDALKDAENAYVKKVPDAPFRTTYHEYVLKRLLRMAAEEGYDSIGWTPADIQADRWSYDYEEGYKIEYDQDIPKFLRKYGKKWGATVGTAKTTEGYDVWSMDITDSMTESVLYEGQVMYSDRVTDKKTLNFLENQEHITTYKSFVEIDGKLYSPMATKVKGDDGKYRLTNPSEIGIWQQAEEKPDSIPKFHKSGYGYYVLKKDDGGSVTAAYNPYEHSSNLVLNDQFESAYQRPNLVTVECIIPKSEMTSGYKAKYAKDSTGYLDWKSGTVAGKLKDNKRKVYLSRWLKPVRILSDSEVAKMYKDILGANISVPFNVVTPQLLTELEKVGVQINYEGSPGYQYRQSQKRTNDGKKFSDRNPDSVSNRSLLANALEATAQNDIERNKLAQYKEKISLIESEQAKLAEVRSKIKELSFAKGKRDTETIKNLQFEANQTANRINTYDKQLLSLESTKALKGVLEREKQMAYKRAEQKGKEALTKQKERNAETQRKLLTRYQESRKKGVESRHKTEMRYKIKTVVSELNQYLEKGTKEKHVPISLQKPVAEALAAVNMDTVGAEERIAKKREEMLKTKSPEAIEKLAKEIEHIQEMGGNMEAKLSRLKTAYDSIINSEDPLIANSHDEVISNTIDKVIEIVGSTPLREMSLYQLEAVYDMYRMVLTTIRKANKAFKQAKGEEISTIANGVIAELDEQKKSPRVVKGLNKLSEFGWNNLKPVYAFERIGSANFTKVFNAVRAGEDVWAKDMSEAQAFREEQYKKHGYDSFDFDKGYDFVSSTGRKFTLNLGQIMSLYAYSKRGSQAKEHLKYGGFQFDGITEVKEKKGKVVNVTYQLKDTTVYKISDELLNEIIGVLDKVKGAKTFVDEMQEYLSSTMGEKGNEVSLEMYEVKLFKEKNYFPLKVSHDFLARAREQAQGDVKIKNSGFTKETKPNAKNPIVLSSFMDVWAGHVNEMSMYHAFTLPLEDFYRVFNYGTPLDEKLDSISVVSSLRGAHRDGAVNYIDQLLKDLNGGARSDPRESWSKARVSDFKKAKVMASLSVVVQQPTAMVRAMALVDSKYFVGKPDGKKHKQAWAEVKKYAPIAVIKEMGYFDTGMGKGSVEWLKGEKTWKDKVDDAVSKAPALADELTWVAIWNAVKRETLHTHKHLKPNSELFLKAVGERFTEVIVKTQVYDSTLARSANMRSKGLFMNMATSFMAEPTTSINMLQDAFRKGKSKKYRARVIGAVYGSVILNSALVSLVYAMRDDDEDETFLEKYLSRFTTEVLDGINPLTDIPFVKDIWSIAQGFDVERADMSLVTDLFDSLQQTIKVIRKDTSDMDEDELAEHKKSIEESVGGIADTISSLFGIPVANVRRDINGIINGFNTIKKDITERDTTAGSLGDNLLEDVKDSVPVWGWLPDESKGEKLYDAIINGDTAYVDRLKSSYKSDNAINSAIRKALRENDPRIEEAATAVVNGDFEKYSEIFDTLVGEGNFTKKDIKSAIDSAVGDMTEKEESSDSGVSKEESKYEMDYIFTEILDGDIVMAYAMKEDLIRTAIANGKDRDEAEATFNNSFTSGVKKRYEEGDITDSKAKSILMNFGGKTEIQATSKVQYWEYTQNNPDKSVSDSWFVKYNEEIATSGISVDKYIDYKLRSKGIEGEDKKARLMAVINSLSISSSQKDALYFAEGWAESKLYEAPWH